jgi:hypothetical protein
MKQKISLFYVKTLRFGLAAIMIIAPFYAPLSVWAASGLKHADFFKIWKEIALTAMGVILATFLLTHHKFVREVLRNRLALAILAYVGLIMIVGVYDLLSGRVGNEAVIYGMIVDLRPVAIFSIAFLTFAIGLLRQVLGFPWRRVVLLPAAAVVFFGLAQLTVLPDDALTHVGYGPNSIEAFQTVDNQPDIIRIQSTLRGPNPLGAYLIIVITMLVAAMLADKRRRFWWGLFTLGALAVMIGSYSRSAEVGLILSMLTLLFIYRGKFIRQHLLAAGIATALLVGGTIGLLAKDNYLTQNLIFHTSENSKSPRSADSERLAAISRSAGEVLDKPLGTGLGSAGPASARNELAEPRIAENYFLQIGQELGWLGMALFISINIMIGRELWRRRSEQLAKVLLASLIGLTFVNLVSHAWTDDALAYIWWGLAGLACSPVILAARRKQHGKAEQKTA